MSNTMLELTPREQSRFSECSRACADWYVNNQNTPANPWGGMHDSADNGRFIYEYYPATGWCSGNGVWGQALGIMGLLTLARRTGADKYRQAALLGGAYLKSLQIVDPGTPGRHGGFREQTPQSTWSYPRDASTGAMGLIALYRETGGEEYLERACWFADWYHDHGSDASGWPWCTYDFQTQVGGYEQAQVLGDDTHGATFIKGDWQAGGGLVYYWLFRLTGEQKWWDYFAQLINPLVEFYERAADKPIRYGFHGTVEATYGNDDFALIVLIAAYRQQREARWLDAIRRHLHRLWTVAESDGSYPSYAGTFVCTLTNIEFLKLVREEKLEEDADGLEQRIMLSARRGLELQENRLPDRRAFGGMYGQSDYGDARDRIHHRSTGYALLMYQRLVDGIEGQTHVPYYSSYGWDREHADR